MRFDHKFTVPAPPSEVWPVLGDVERVVPCLPGATLTELTGRDLRGKLRVRVGPVTVTYQGTARFTERDERNHRAVLTAQAKEARGSGTAKATITAQLHDEGARTRVEVRTDLVLTGRLAQSGRSALNDVGTRMVSRFADQVTALLARDEAGPETHGAGGADAVGDVAADTEADADSRPERARAVEVGTDRPAPVPTPGPARVGTGGVTGDPEDLLSAVGQRTTRRWTPLLAALVVLVLLLRHRRRQATHTARRAR